MPAHGLVSGVAVDDLTSAIVKACKDSGLILGVQLGLLDDGVELRIDHGTTNHLAALLLNLASVGIVVDLTECEVTVVGSRPRVTAKGMRVVEDTVHDYDLSERAGVIFVEVSDGAAVHEPELVAGHVAARLLGQNPAEFRAVRALSFKRKDGA